MEFKFVKGDLNQALNLASKALIMYKKLGLNDQNMVTLISNIAAIHRKISDNRNLQISFSYYIDAMEKAAELQIEGTSLYIYLLNEMGKTCQNIGTSEYYNKAVKLYKEALIRAKTLHGENTDHIDIANTINHLADVEYKLSGVFKSFAKNQSLEMKERLYSQGNLEMVESYYNLGMDYKQLEPDKAISLFKKSRKFVKSLNSEEISPEEKAIHIAKCLSNIGDCHLTLNYDESLKNNQKALNDYLKIKNTAQCLEVANLLNDIGCVYDKKGDSDTALDRKNQALEILFSLKSSYELQLSKISVYESLANTYLQKAEIDAVNKKYKESLQNKYLAINFHERAL